MTTLKNFTVKYQGNATQFKNFSTEVSAENERQAVITAYRYIMPHNFFDQEDGTILDCDGDQIAGPNSTTIEHDGGCFYADEND